MEGVYDGSVTVGSLKQYGDFGLGTLESLDGEMIEQDSNFYQVKVDGTVNPVPDAIKVPFACLTFFDTDNQQLLQEGMDFQSTQSLIDDLLPTVNIFHAIKISGTFSYMKTRSVPAQTQPYPPLSEVTKHQRVFEFKEIEGTIIGFRCPPYTGSINLPGYHFHFLSKEKNAGGHVLDFRTRNATVFIDYTPNLLMLLPEHEGSFREVDLIPADEKNEAMEKVEK